ncbi:MAG TPA: MFS transporter [Acidimicrobiales bacterium]|nr:MFS transporter [Acidimicrobiales bacterium]
MGLAAGPTSPDLGDEGYDSPRAWGMVAASFVSMFVVFGVAYSFGAFFGPISRTFHAGSGATSLVFSLTAFAYFALGAVSGPAADRFGPRVVLAVGAVVMGAGVAATSLVGRLWLAYLTYGLGVGVGVACGYVPMLGVVGGWFRRRRSTALGVAVAGIGVGTLAISPLAAVLIDHIGWRHTEVVFGALSAVLLAACAVVARRPPAHAGGPVGAPGRQVLLSPAFVWLYVSGILGSMALYIPFVFLVPYAHGRGMSRVAAASLVGLVGASSTVGRLALGPVAERAGLLRSYRACFVVLGGSFLFWLVGRSALWLIVFALVFGLGYGGFIALSPAVAAELFGVRGLGGVLGVLYSGAGLGALVGPPLAGLVIDVTGSYEWAVGAGLILSAGALVCLLPLRPGMAPA